MIRQSLILISMCLIFNACIPSKNTLVIGHRGAKGHLAENTLPSIDKAMYLGVDGVEIDIFRCASGELVVFHDQTLEKLTNATGYIEQLDLDSIRKIEVLGGFTIPTLEEVLNLIDGQVSLNIELKGSQTALLTDSLLKIFFMYEAWSPEKILISSFNWDELKVFYNINKEVPIAVLTEDDPIDAIPVAQSLKAKAINPNFKSLTKENVYKIKKVGIQIFPWTVNQPDDISRMIDLGVDGIITDFPERIIKK
ncbi:glycerophosphodiester phosphodiesterase family protein [Flavobacteriaceae bacterium]|nr:glycerophosphodiester phosphodiesterase family protein [Flavobacteriaceae bacterium]